MGEIFDAICDVGSAISDLGGEIVDVINDNPGKSLLVVGATIATGGLALVAAPTLAATATAVAAGGGSMAAGIATNSLLSVAASEGVSVALVESAELTAKKAALYMAAEFVAKQLTEHVVDNYIKENVRPVKGCIVYCDLGLVAEHSGIYVGDDKIIHLDGAGNIEIVTREKFLDRLGGFNTAMSIYVSCSDCNAVGDSDAAERAIDMAGNYRDYNVVFNNCHQFASGCITGNFANSDNFLWMLKHTTEQHYAANSWRVWGTHG